jgi:CHAT domain-containing protein
MGGFAANLLDNGCSGVIAPYWPVEDERARKFALALYQKLSLERSVGEALQELRAEMRDDITFQAFTYFGDPWARLDSGNIY